MSSFGHDIRRLDADDREYLARMIAAHGPRHYSCATRNCDEPAEFETTYRYITGRRGRVSWARRRACSTHGLAFASKHGLDVSELTT